MATEFFNEFREFVGSSFDSGLKSVSGGDYIFVTENITEIINVQPTEVT